jgi:hypothetical protein
MPSLTIRDIPETLLRRMRRAAQVERRSLNSQAVQWLEQSAKQWTPQQKRRELMEAIQSEREAIYQRHGAGTETVELIRKMRWRGKA